MYYYTSIYIIYSRCRGVHREYQPRTIMVLATTTNATRLTRYIKRYTYTGKEKCRVRYSRRVHMVVLMYARIDKRRCVFCGGDDLDITRNGFAEIDFPRNCKRHSCFICACVYVGVLRTKYYIIYYDNVMQVTVQT